MATYLRLDGTAGTFASCPDIAALAGAMTLDVEIDVALDVWAAALRQTLMGHGLTVPRAIWFAADAPTNRFYLDTPVNGGPSATPGFVSPVNGFADGSRQWGAIRWKADEGGLAKCQFQTSVDGSVWTNQGAEQTHVTELPTGLANATWVVTLGALADTAAGTGSFRATGNFHKARIYAPAGVLVASPDFTDLSPGYTGTVTDAQGNVWTLSGAAVIRGTATHARDVAYQETARHVTYRERP